MSLSYESLEAIPAFTKVESPCNAARSPHREHSSHTCQWSRAQSPSWCVCLWNVVGKRRKPHWTQRDQNRNLTVREESSTLNISFHFLVNNNETPSVNNPRALRAYSKFFWESLLINLFKNHLKLDSPQSASHFLLSAGELVCLSVLGSLAKLKRRENRQGGGAYSSVILWSHRWWGGDLEEIKDDESVPRIIFSIRSAGNFWASRKAK